MAFTIYIPKFGKISVKFSFGVLCLYRCINGGEIWHGRVDRRLDLWSTHPCQISPPSVQRVVPVGRKNSKSPS